MFRGEGCGGVGCEVGSGEECEGGGGEEEEQLKDRLSSIDLLL